MASVAMVTFAAGSRCCEVGWTQLSADFAERPWCGSMYKKLVLPKSDNPLMVG